MFESAPIIAGSAALVAGVTALLIFCARILDVSLGTLRIISVAKGRKYLAPLLGFFEILIWLTAISRVMRSDPNPYYFLAYASGFALGNYIGILVEEKLAIGTLLVRVILHGDPFTLLEAFRRERIGFTCVEGTGSQGPVKVVFSILRRRRLPCIIALIKEFEPGAFFTIGDIHSAREELTVDETRARFRLFRWVRKGK